MQATRFTGGLDTVSISKIPVQRRCFESFFAGGKNYTDIFARFVDIHDLSVAEFGMGYLCTDNEVRQVNRRLFFFRQPYNRRINGGRCNRGLLSVIGLLQASVATISSEKGRTKGSRET